MKSETFSYLPPMTDEQIENQIRFFLNNDWVIGVEFTRQLGASLGFWEWWKLPFFTLRTSADIMKEFDACRQAHLDCYIRITAYDAKEQKQTAAFVAYRPAP